MLDPKDFPVADKQVAAGDIETTPTDSDMIALLNAAQDQRKALTLADLFLNAPPIAADSLKLTATELTVSGAIDPSVSYVELNHASVLIAATIAAPAAGRLLIITQTDGGTVGHTVTLSAGSWDGSATIVTLNAQYETLVVFGVSATRFVIVENIGTIALS